MRIPSPLVPALLLASLVAHAPASAAAGMEFAVELEPGISAEYPSGAWHLLWPTSPWSPMVIYQVELDLSGGAGSFVAYPQTATAGCADYAGACPLMEGQAFHDGHILELRGTADEGTRTGNLVAIGTGTGKIMGMNIWIAYDDGTGRGADTYMRKLAVQ